MNTHTNISIPAEIVIGKDVLELVSSAMYVDPLTIYREYVQNAADSIDEARATGVLRLDEPGRVDITIDHQRAIRSVKIRDNGCGVPNGQFAKRLTAIGGSHKRGSAARGFRGVGRLAGLGYCQEVIFRSRALGDPVVQELRWDCRVFKSLLSDHTYQGNLHDLVQAVVTIREIDGQDWPEHFYEVELVKLNRIGRDTLLNREAIALYLSQVAPVPFSSEFPFGAEIRAQLIEHLGEMGEIEIYIDGASAPVYRPYREDFAYGEGKRDVFIDAPQVTVIEGLNGGVSAVVWLLHHGYHGAIPIGEGVCGLRARKGNIQIGDHRIFAEVFPEDRFASWTVGEVHVLDERVMPNGRRDDFEQNVHYVHLCSRLSEIGAEIGRLCRSNSVVRNRLKAFELGALSVDEKLAILEQGAIDNASAEVLVQTIRGDLHEMKKAVEALASEPDDHHDLSERFVGLERRLAKAEGAATAVGALQSLAEQDRGIVQRMIGLIYEASSNRITAKLLVDRILARLGED